MTTFKQFISEGINDRGIFKAMFVIGLPGAGKSYTVKQLKGAVSPRVVNTDTAVEHLGKKMQKIVNSDSWNEFRDSAHRITKGALTQYLNGMLPLFVDGTSNDVSNILHRIGILESLGYDVGVVFVNTPLETALKRARERGVKTGRHVDEDFIRAVDSRNKENARYLKDKVNFFRQIENGDNELGDKQISDAFKATQHFFDEKVRNPVGIRFLEKLRANQEKYLSPNIVSIDVMSKKVDGWYKS